MRTTKLLRYLFLLLALSTTVIINFISSRAQTSNVPALVLAQGLNDTTIQLTWMAVTGATSYKIYRGGSLLTSQPGTLFNDSSLAPSTTYSYQVSAVVGGVESPRSTTVAATTEVPHDASPPTQPGSITVSNITSSTATLTWGTSSDNVQVLGYRILRGAVGAPLSALVQIATTEASTSYTATNLFASHTYQFAVRAIDAADNLSPASTATFTTTSVSDTTPPAAPLDSSVAPNVFSSSRVDVLWGSSSSSDVSGYQIFRDGALIGEVDFPLRHYYSDNGLAAASTHSYQVRAIDSAGNVSALTTARRVITSATGTVKIVRGPYIQWTTTNSTRIAWWTDIPAPSVVNYGVASLSTQVSDPVLTLQHVMLIGGLNPATSYQYQVVSKNATSATLAFLTAPLPGATFTFAAVGDYGGDSPQERSIANEIAAGGTQFIQTLGDNVYPDAQDPDFATTYYDFDSRFYKPYATAMGQQTLWLSGGNHEYYDDGAFWQNIWMPNNERWYSYDWGDAHFLVLDTEVPFAPGSPEYQFAQADLIANQSKLWRIVVLHRPPYSSSNSNASSTLVRSYLVPLFEQQHVQLVLAGHSHNYERTYPLIGGVPQTTGGVTYIVSGGGGNGINSFTTSPPSWSAFRLASFEYLRITVSLAAIQLDAINDSGTIFDSDTISASSATNTPTPTSTLTPTVTSTAVNAPKPVGPGTYDDTDLAWVYSGNWTAYTSSGPYNGTLHYTNVQNASAAISFTGTQFTVYFTKYPNRGNVEVWIDGSLVSTFNENGTSLAWQQSWTLPTPLSNGVHTVQFKNSSANTAVYIDIDAIQILGPVGPGTYDDTNPAWSYAGNWTNYSNTGPYNNTLHYTNLQNASASLTFTGTQFTLYFTKYPNRGDVDVWIDGVKQYTFSENSSSLAWQQSWTLPTPLSNGTHTVQFKNPSSNTSVYIDIDAIQILGPVGPGIYDDTNPIWSYAGNWTTYTSSGPYNNTLHYTNAENATAAITFTGTQFTVYFTKYPNRGDVEVWIDGVKQYTFSENSSSLAWQQSWALPTTLSNGTHSVQFKNPNANTSTYIDIDAIVISS